MTRLKVADVIKQWYTEANDSGVIICCEVIHTNAKEERVTKTYKVPYITLKARTEHLMNEINKIIDHTLGDGCETCYNATIGHDDEAAKAAAEKSQNEFI